MYKMYIQTYFWNFVTATEKIILVWNFDLNFFSVYGRWVRTTVLDFTLLWNYSYLYSGNYFSLLIDTV